MLQLDIGTLLGVLGFIAVLIGTWVRFNNKIAIIETKLKEIEKDAGEAERRLNRAEQDAKDRQNFINVKLVNIEKDLVENGTFLRENIKQLTSIVGRHETQIDFIQKSMIEKEK